MKRNGWQFLLAAGLIFLLLSVTPTCAQGDFTTAPVLVGDSIRVTLPASGTIVNGPLTAITRDSLTVGNRRIDHEPGLRIAREGDNLWNGILIGVGIGLLAGPTIGAEACLDRSIAYCAVGGAVVWGGIGALMDWRHKGFTVVYRDPALPTVTLTPSIGPQGAALHVALSF